VRCPQLLRGAIKAVTPEQLEQVLTVLGRAAPQHPQLVQTIAATIRAAGPPGGIAALTLATRLEQPQPVLDALEPLLSSESIPTLQALSDVLPRFSLLLSPISLRIAEGLVTRLRAALTENRDAYLPDLARSVDNLAVRLAAAGLRAEGLTAAQEAVDLRRELVELNRDAYLPAPTA
jgi:hypothetical protein